MFDLSPSIANQTKVQVLKGRNSAGYTLIELMVSIVLGLLLVAAATQLFWGGVLSTRLQQAGADVQDNGTFGLAYIAKDLRLANYGNDINLSMDDTTAWGGVVLTTTNLASSGVTTGLLSHSDGEAVGSGNEWTGISNVTQNSDQLTIQFQAPYATTNCEGQSVLAGDLVVERYFLREDGTSSDTQIKNLALVCDANDPSTTTANAQPATLTGFGGAGQIIMSRVDQFHVLLGARNSSGDMSYYTIAQYKAAAIAARAASKPVPSVVSVKISVLVRSLDNTNSRMVDPSKSYLMLDQTVTPNTASGTDTNRFVRQVYSTSVAFRNALGG